MSPTNDRQTLPATPPPPAAPPVPTALRRDGTAPRSLAQRLLMLLILVGISLSVAIPILVVNGIFGQRPGSKPASAAQPTPEPAGGLRTSLQLSAEKLLPPPAPLGPEPIILTVRPANIAARLETVLRQTAQFGGTATEGLANGGERHLYVDLPPAAATAFRQAVTARPSATDAPPGPLPSLAATASPAGTQEHVEVILRPAGDDE